jgi:pyruvate kinase
MGMSNYWGQLYQFPTSSSIGNLVPEKWTSKKIIEEVRIEKLMLANNSQKCNLPLKISPAADEYREAPGPRQTALPCWETMMRKTKIVATIGPSSESPAVIEKLIEMGMNVARLNFSHGSHAEHAEKIRIIREIADRRGLPIAILQDLSGPKIRIGEIEGTITLNPDERLTLTCRQQPGTEKTVSTNYAPLAREVTPGDRLLLADGALELEVLDTDGEDIVTRVIVGGKLSSHKGINLPNSTLSVPCLTDKDLTDLRFGLEQGVDLVALSFVRQAEDITEIRSRMDQIGIRVPVIAKIEKHEAVSNMDAIIEAADGIMVARGDLGVEIPLEQVPGVQKQLIGKCNRAGKPVITATQMLGSMVTSTRPTRAEVTDVANAILDGSDAIMLSEESAAGDHPVMAVETMARVAEETETFFPHDTWIERLIFVHREKLEEAVAKCACDLAADIAAKAIIPFSNSGNTTRLVAKYRPRLPILAPTPRVDTYRYLNLSWGVIPLLCETMDNTDEMVTHALEIAVQTGYVASGEKVILTAGIPVGKMGTTNMIKAEVIP